MKRIDFASHASLWVMGAGLFLLLGACARETTPQDRLPIIDMHMHAFPALGGPPLDEMERYNIVLGFLSPGGGAGSDENEIFEWVDAVPRRFIASPGVGDPGEVDLAGLRREYEAGRFGGMGEIGSQYHGIAADDPVLEPFFALAEEFDVPVLIHSHGTGAPNPKFRIDIGRPTRIEEVLARHPTLRISIESSGFPFLESTMALMLRYPNVYGDLSAWKQPREIFEWYIHRLVDAGLGSRLMFGSDVTRRPEVIGTSIEGIESIPFLTQEQKRDILYNNAARFLQLTEEDIAAHHNR